MCMTKLMFTEEARYNLNLYDASSIVCGAMEYVRLVSMQTHCRRVLHVMFNPHYMEDGAWEGA